MWRHIFEGEYVGRQLKGLHHAVMGMAPRGLRVTHVIPRQEKTGFYKALVYRVDTNGEILRPKNGKYSTMFPDEWSREYVQEIVNKGFYRVISKGGGKKTDIDIPLSDILGNRYKGISLRYHFNKDGSMASVYPIL